MGLSHNPYQNLEQSRNPENKDKCTKRIIKDSSKTSSKLVNTINTIIFLSIYKNPQIFKIATHSNVKLSTQNTYRTTDETFYSAKLEQVSKSLRFYGAFKRVKACAVQMSSVDR